MEHLAVTAKLARLLTKENSVQLQSFNGDLSNHIEREEDPIEKNFPNSRMIVDLFSRKHDEGDYNNNI